ncbi:MAG: hypothetical protein JWL73_368 [Actinomycetia bacterium]|nr:hypothetical protein [Actinomycetes bacterium]
MKRDALRIYLGDHLAGAGAGVEIARRIADSYKGTAEEPAFRQLAADIEADRQTLIEIRERLDMARAPLKEAVAWVGEKVAQIKLSDAVTGDAHMTRLLELETLETGISGKLGLWRALEVVPSPERLGVDLELLERRAKEQRRFVEQHRIEEARAAFAA